MKIKGNMRKASAFTPDLFPPPTEENFKKYAGGASTGGASASSGSSSAGGLPSVFQLPPPALKSDSLFNLMALYFTTGDAQKNVDKIKAVFQLDLIPKKGQPPVRRWAIDMKNGQGSVKYGVAEKSDVQFTMTEDDFIAIQDGKLNPQTAFMTVRILY